MEIPIRFKFFDKLKLYQDYLKQDSMLQRTKSTYWLAVKLIMFWGYSYDHQHLGVPLNVKLFITKSDKILESAGKIGVNEPEAINWVKNNIENSDKLIRLVGNMLTLELVTKLVDSHNNNSPIHTNSQALDPGDITINLKGFLLGELLFETYEKPKFWSKNFRKYKLALFVFYLTFFILLLTAYIIFFKQLVDLIGTSNFSTISSYLVNLLNQSWWSIFISCLLIIFGLRQLWNRL